MSLIIRTYEPTRFAPLMIFGESTSAQKRSQVNETLTACLEPEGVNLRSFRFPNAERFGTILP